MSADESKVPVVIVLGNTLLFVEAVVCAVFLAILFVRGPVNPLDEVSFQISRFVSPATYTSKERLVVGDTIRVTSAEETSAPVYCIGGGCILPVGGTCELGHGSHLTAIGTYHDWVVALYDKNVPNPYYKGNNWVIGCGPNIKVSLSRQVWDRLMWEESSFQKEERQQEAIQKIANSPPAN